MTGRILEVGPPPEMRWRRPENRGERAGSWVPNPGIAWPEAFEPLPVGHYVTFPRDVPIVFFWKETRYAIIHRHECLLCVADPSVLEFLAREA